jgi:hypothetical protein
MTPKDLVENLLSEDGIVDKIVSSVERYLGDVITDETDDATAREECWTLCIDKANDLIGQGPRAIAAAKEACAILGYPPKGYRPRKEKPAQPVWPPQVGKPGRPAQEPERVVKPTGVVHGPYRPPFMDDFLKRNG